MNTSTAHDLSEIAQRKRDHLLLCAGDRVAFTDKTTQFELYDFENNALAPVNPESISTTVPFFSKEVSFPLMISCMTGGRDDVNDINSRFITVARELNIPVGIGSMRYAMHDRSNDPYLKGLRSEAGPVPLVGNIGAAQAADPENIPHIVRLAELIEADAFAVHLNPSQELLQKHGEPSFAGLLHHLPALRKAIGIPLIIKEVGAGISGVVARKLLAAGADAIDVAGAGGTSWTGVEILRNGDDTYAEFWDWGIPTAACIRQVSLLKDESAFLLIGSGGVNTPFEFAKAIALGADFAASARALLKPMMYGGIEETIKTLHYWFDVFKKIMYLTGSASVQDLQKGKIRLRNHYD